MYRGSSLRFQPLLSNLSINGNYKISKRFFGVRHKLVDLEDAVSIVKNRDTLCVSGFVSQSCPEALLRALGQKYVQTNNPKDLTLLFGGGPGDYSHRGLNHLGKPGMLRTAIGGHFGQVPMIADLVLSNKIAGYALPLGSISRMIRATASNSPGHITKVGLGTMVDPRQDGGALNDKARNHALVEVMNIDNHEYLRYRPVPIQVAFIRATTADPEGNLTMEHESILGDAKIIAMAARSSGGIVVAQVERLAAHGSLPSRSVHIPGTFVDCVVLADKEEHGVSFTTRSNPVWTGEIREPMDNIPRMDLNARKIIARRAAMELKPDDIVNLGIGMPEGVAAVASEEGIFKHVTLTTEAGVVGGVGAKGKEFGPASNPEAFNEMNQQFDLYDGNGLNVCFLGLAQCSSNGNVNVSRLSENSLTGPGGFIDIAQSTQRVVFMGTFTKKGMVASIEKGELKIEQEGKFRTFESSVREITFAAEQALANGQHVIYITERCVFELNFRGLKLIEIAPGIDLEKDILAHMSIKPYIKDPDKIKIMDKRIFEEQPMKLFDDMFSIEKQMMGRIEYQPDTHTMFLDLNNYSITKQTEIEAMEKAIADEFDRILEAHDGGKCHVIVNYEGFDCKSTLTDSWATMASRLQDKYYATVKRYSGHVFMRQKLGNKLNVESDEDLWNSFTKGGRVLSRTSLVHALQRELHIKPSIELIHYLMNKKEVLKRREFASLLERLREYGRSLSIPKSSESTSSDYVMEESEYEPSL